MSERPTAGPNGSTSPSSAPVSPAWPVPACSPRPGARSCVFEASDGIGGRVRTDLVDGFQLDRGFQVLFTAYPEAQRQLDYDALDLRSFEPGALVRLRWAFPSRARPVSVGQRRASIATSALDVTRAPIGTLPDKARLAKLRRSLLAQVGVRLLRGPDIATSAALRERGFSESIIDRFFRPLFGGIQLDLSLTTSNRMFDVMFRTLANGNAALPAKGMGAIPAQLAASLPAEAIRLRLSSGRDRGHDALAARRRAHRSPSGRRRDRRTGGVSAARAARRAIEAGRVRLVRSAGGARRGTLDRARRRGQRSGREPRGRQRHRTDVRTRRSAPHRSGVPRHGGAGHRGRGAQPDDGLVRPTRSSGGATCARTSSTTRNPTSARRSTPSSKCAWASIATLPATTATPHRSRERSTRDDAPARPCSPI